MAGKFDSGVMNFSRLTGPLPYYTSAVHILSYHWTIIMGSIETSIPTWLELHRCISKESFWSLMVSWSAPAICFFCVANLLTLLCTFNQACPTDVLHLPSYNKVYMHYLWCSHPTDINECALEMYPCHSNANCTDTNGSFICTCMAGFEGDGFNCTGNNGMNIYIFVLCYLLTLIPSCYRHSWVRQRIGRMWHECYLHQHSWELRLHM